MGKRPFFEKTPVELPKPSPETPNDISESNSYENPTFHLDKSIDSSISEFFHDAPAEEDFDLDSGKFEEGNEKMSSLTIVLGNAANGSRILDELPIDGIAPEQPRFEAKGHQARGENSSSFWGGNRRSFRGRKSARKKKPLKDLESSHKDRAPVKATSTSSRVMFINEEPNCTWEGFLFLLGVLENWCNG